MPSYPRIEPRQLPAVVPIGGRNIIKDYDTQEPVLDGPYNVRTMVHEYGGGQSVAYNGSIYFSNLPDNRVYEIKPGTTQPVPVVPGAYSVSCVIVLTF